MMGGQLDLYGSIDLHLENEQTKLQIREWLDKYYIIQNFWN